MFVSSKEQLFHVIYMVVVLVFEVKEYKYYLYSVGIKNFGRRERFDKFKLVYFDVDKNLKCLEFITHSCNVLLVFL